MSKQIEILCPQTGLIKIVNVCSDQTVASMFAELGWHDATLYHHGHAIDPESTFAASHPQDPGLLGPDELEVEPYRLGG